MTDSSLSQDSAPPGSSAGNAPGSGESPRRVDEPETSGQLLRRVQQVAQIGGWVFDPEADTVTGTEHLFELLEMPDGADFTLESGLNLYPPDARERVGRAIQQCLQEGESFDLEVPLVTWKGTRRWVRVRGERHRADDGHKQLIGTLQDVSGEHQIRDSLEAEQKVLREMYRITSDQEAALPLKIRELIDLGREHLDLPYGFLTRVKQGTQRIIESRGTHPLLQPGASCPLSRSYCRKTLERGRLLAIQNAVEEDWTSDPAFETFSLGTYIGATVIVEGETYGTFCFAAHEPRSTPFTERERTFVELLSRWASYEIEQQRAAEELKSQNEHLDRLASVVTHDLRNPLNVAQGRLGLLEEKLAEGTSLDKEEIDGHLAAVRRAHKRIHMIIDDMMSLTRGRQRLGGDDIEQVALGTLAETCWDQVDTASATLTAEHPHAIRAAPGRLQQLLENLFRNAVDHGGSDVTVGVGPLDDGFYVEDDGDGIPEEDQERIFEASFSTREEGTGLGLSIAEAVADAHGWDLSIAESEDGGVRLEITGVDVVERAP